MKKGKEIFFCESLIENLPDLQHVYTKIVHKISSALRGESKNEKKKNYNENGITIPNSHLVNHPYTFHLIFSSFLFLYIPLYYIHSHMTLRQISRRAWIEITCHNCTWQRNFLFTFLFPSLICSYNENWKRNKFNCNWKRGSILFFFYFFFHRN